jgi:hypothetical protein
MITPWKGKITEKTITNQAADHATRNSAIASSPTVLGALKRTLQELLGSVRWYGTMPIEYLVVWAIAPYDDREEMIVNEELIKEEIKEREKNGRTEKANERKSTKERKGMRNCAEAKRPEKSPITTKRARLLPRGTKTLRRTTRRRAMRLLPPELHRGDA